MSATLPGKITISRPGGYDPEHIEFSVTDAVSGEQFLTIRLSLTGFAEALTGQGRVECALDLRNIHRVGAQAEHMERRIRTRAEMTALAADGWRARHGDFGNGHRGSDGAGYMVNFSRHLDANGKPIL